MHLGTNSSHFGHAANEVIFSREYKKGRARMKRKGPTCGRRRKGEGPECKIDMRVNSLAFSHTKAGLAFFPFLPYFCSTTGLRRGQAGMAARHEARCCPKPRPSAAHPILHRPATCCCSSSSPGRCCYSSTLHQGAATEGTVTPAITRDLFPFSNSCCSFSLG